MIARIFWRLLLSVLNHALHLVERLEKWTDDEIDKVLRS